MTAKGLSRAFWISTAWALWTCSVIGQAPRSLVVFPVGLSDTVFSPEGFSLEDSLTASLEAALKKDARLKCIVFTRNHPSIKRALSEGTIPASHLLPPFTGRSGGEYRALVLGRLMRADLGIAGIVDRYRYDAAKGSAEIVLSLELFDVRAGKQIGSVALTGSATGASEVEAAKAAVAVVATEAAKEAIPILTGPSKATGGGER